MTIKTGLPMTARELSLLRRENQFTTTYWTAVHTYTSGGTEEWGAGAVYDGYGNLYFLAYSSGSAYMYRYSFATFTRTQLAVTTFTVPTSALHTTAMAYDGYKYIYIFPANSDTFYRYSIEANSFSAMTSAPASSARGSLAYDGNDYIYLLVLDGNLYRYSISGNSWTTLTASGNTYNYGICFNNDNKLYCVSSNASNTFEYIGVYDIGLASWSYGEFYIVGTNVPQCYILDGYYYIVQVTPSPSYRYIIYDKTNEPLASTTYLTKALVSDGRSMIAVTVGVGNTVHTIERMFL